MPANRATALDVPGQGGNKGGSQAGSHRADISFRDGLLTVNASGSSLNAVVREIARQTGMKVTGSVRDDRVFGSYGPAEPSAILSTLLEGTGSNMLLVNNAANAPAQLILTPRLGAPTPPRQGSMAAERDGDEEEAEPANLGRSPAFSGPPPPQALPARPNVQPGQDLTPQLSSPTTNNSDSQTVVFPAVSATTTPATATTSSDTTQTPPDGVKTPQQIFEQLQKLRQQQEQTQPASPPQ